MQGEFDMIIRINLHPNRKVKAKSNPATWVLLICFLIAIVILGLFWAVTSRLDDETEDLNLKSNQIQAEIDQIKERINDITTIRAKIEDLNKRQVILARYTSIRQGPQFVLNELSRLLSNPRDVVGRKEASELGWLLAWEPDNVMLKSFKDIGNGQIELNGTARTMEDIQEFWTRMKTSQLLRNIKLLEIKDSKDYATNEIVQEFTFSADANFNYQTQEGRALIESLTQEESPDAEDAEGAAEPEAQPEEN